MKLLFRFAAILLIGLGAATSHASSPASDNAADSAYNGGWQTGSNGGSGFGAWDLGVSISGSNQNGFIVQSSGGTGDGSTGNIDTGGRSLGMYADGNNGVVNALAVAYRPFTGPLNIGQTVFLSLDNGYIDNGGIVGFSLVNSDPVSANAVFSALPNNATRFAYTFTGGDNDYRINIGTGSGPQSTDTGIGWTANGMSLAFTLTGADSYSLSINGGPPITGALGGTSGQSLNGIAIFNYIAGSGASNYAFVNNIRVAQASASQNPNFEVSLDPSGNLTFNQVASPSGYKVEWATSPDGPWQSFSDPYTALNSVAATGSGSITVTVPQLSPAIFYHVVENFASVIDASSTIQAESYTADYGAIQIGSGGSGSVVGYYDGGDWLEYSNVNFGFGMASVIFSASKANTGGTVEIRVDGVNGPLLGVFTPAPTGDWGTYAQQQINVSSVTGIHNVYLVAVGAPGVCNLDWFTFSTLSLHVPNYVLVWSDEFNGTQLDPTKWHAVQVGEVPNGELEFYTTRPQNVSVSNGFLNLTANQEVFTGTGLYTSGTITSNYTSGKIQTDGLFSIQYGKSRPALKCRGRPAPGPRSGC